MQEELVELAQVAAGDADAFARWMSRVETSVRLSLRPFATLVDTEAVLQEAFLRVWQVAPRFVHDGRPNGLLRLTVTTARNAAISELRRTAPSRETLEALEHELARNAEVVPITPDPALRAAIQHCRGKLPPQPARALAERLSAAGGERDATLAQRAGMTLNTFLANFGRARTLLKKCLEAVGIDLALELSP